MTPADVQATFCATLVDELVAHGVRHAVVAPGSRSTPMALALTAVPDLAVHVVHDERSAAFVALGLGLGGTPAILLCTSGTAAANFHPAVVEAGLSEVPMIVLTADRPPELRDVGAPQTIDQTHLYGRSVRWFHDPGVPAAAAAGTWRSLAARAFAAAARGPVHLNLPFREPLVGDAGALPPRRPFMAGSDRVSARAVTPGIVDLLRQERGVILAGGGGAMTADLVVPFAEATGWPVLADPTSGLRAIPGAIAPFDAVLRHDRLGRELRPDVVVRLGRPAASKVLAQWVGASGAPVVQVGGPGVVDPDHTVVAHLDAASLPVVAGQLVGLGTDWRDRWTAAASIAEAAIDEVLGPESPLTEPAIARNVARHLPDGAELVVASSMPVRDLEWFGGITARAHANRGANGIDGVLSTALGIALGGRPTVVLVGDIAFVHDAGALTALAGRRTDLRIVVVDNDGGGIFSFLPQAAALTPDRFEQLFGTPHGTDVVALARAHGLDAATVTTAVELVDRLTAPGPSVTRVATDRAGNVDVHTALNAAVTTALDTI